jgi:hypothetical protein
MSNNITSSIVNADNRDLQPLSDHGITIGFVDEVNGPGAREVPEFTPTRTELLELVKYWTLIFLEWEHRRFETATAGSREVRMCPYADRRVYRIIELLGDDAAKAVHEVSNQFAERVEPLEWERFQEFLGSHHLHGAATGRPNKRKPTGTSTRAENRTEPSY